MPKAPDTKQQGMDWSQSSATVVLFDIDTAEGTNEWGIIEDNKDTTKQNNPAAKFRSCS